MGHRQAVVSDHSSQPQAKCQRVNATPRGESEREIQRRAGAQVYRVHLREIAWSKNESKIQKSIP